MSASSTPGLDHKPSVAEGFVFRRIGCIAKLKHLIRGSVELVGEASAGPRLPASEPHPVENLLELDEAFGIKGVRRSRPTPEHLAAQQRSVVHPLPGVSHSCPTRSPLPPPRPCTAVVASVAPQHSPFVSKCMGLLQDVARAGAGTHVPAKQDVAQRDRQNVVAALSASARIPSGPAASAHQFGVFGNIAEAEAWYDRIGCNTSSRPP